MKNLLTRLPSLPPIPLIAGGLALAFWPVFRWWVARMGDGSDDPLGFAALLVAGGFLWARRREVRVSLYGVWMALGLILTQAVIPLPPLIRGICLVAALAGTLCLPRRQPGITALLFLSLPVVASLQYFAGYPLRLVTAESAVWLLNAMGIGVGRVGTLMNWRGHEVGVDAACSGIKLLWVSAFTAAALAARFRLTWQRTLALLGTGLGLVVLLNAVRSAILFFPESGLVVWPESTHEGIGAGLFVMVAATLAGVAGKWAPQGNLSGNNRPAPVDPAPLPLSTAAAWIAATVCSAVLALVQTPAPVSAAAFETVEWPAWFEGETLRPVPLSPCEERFAAGFPGQMNVFKTPSGRTLIFRRVLRASRGLHSSADCLRASGYSVHPEPLFMDDQKRAWGDYQVSGAPADADTAPVRRLRELIVDANGRTYPDPSSWFWPALFGQSNGPWTAITVMD
ncbi:MAG: exosortase [Verrucomicrobiales bacterium]|nr:exosortase [Verrucomicrobiales bacterium]